MENSFASSVISHIESTIIYPISKSQTQASFVIQSSGLLDKDSAIQIPVKTRMNFVESSGGGNSGYGLQPDCFLPVNLGVWSCIKTATLRSLDSGTVIAQNNDCSNWYNIHQNHQSSEWRRRVGMARHGIMETYNMSDVGQIPAGDVAQTSSVGGLCIDGLMYPEAIPATGITNGGSFDTKHRRNYRITDDTLVNRVIANGDEGNASGGNLNSGTAPTLQGLVRLNELFPKIFSVQLPTHLILGKLQLDIVFQDLEKRVCRTYQSATGASVPVASADAEIDLDNLVMLADFIHKKDDSALIAQINSPDGYTSTYGDLIWNQFRIPLTAGATPANPKQQNKTFNMGMANQIIRQMYLVYNREGTAQPVQSRDVVPDNGADCLKNVWKSECPSSIVDGFKFQINLNGRNLYPDTIENKGRFENELIQAYGAKFHKPYDTYQGDTSHTQQVDTDTANNQLINTFAGLKGMLNTQQTVQGWGTGNLYNSNFVQGIDLQKSVLDQDGNLNRINIPNSGTLISNTPIYLHLNTTQTSATKSQLVNVCSIVERTIQIRNGKINVVE